MISLRIIFSLMTLFVALTAQARDVSLSEGTQFFSNWYQNWDQSVQDGPQGEASYQWLLDHVSGESLKMTFRMPVNSKQDLKTFLNSLKAGHVSSLHEMKSIKKSGVRQFQFVVAFLSNSARGEFNGSTLITVDLSDDTAENLKIEKYIVQIIGPFDAAHAITLDGTPTGQ